MKHRLQHQLADGTLVDFEFEIVDYNVSVNNFLQDWSPGHAVIGKLCDQPQTVNITGRLTSPLKFTMPTKKRKRK